MLKIDKISSNIYLCVFYCYRSFCYHLLHVMVFINGNLQLLLSANLLVNLKNNIFLGMVIIWSVFKTELV